MKADNVQSRTLVLLGTAVSLALGVIALNWVPYGDSGTPEAANNHFFALAAAVIAVLLPFFYAAYLASAVSPPPRYSGMMATYFLGLNAFITIGFFFRTYFASGYSAFWTAQVLQWALLLVVLVAANYVGRTSENREEGAKLASARKESIVAELQAMRCRFPPGDNLARQTLVSLADKIVEELRYFPNQEMPVTASSFGRVTKWRVAVESFFSTPSAHSSETISQAAPHELIVEATSIASALAGFKR